MKKTKFTEEQIAFALRQAETGTRVAAALLDRLLHHAIVVETEGHSYRLREHANLVPDTLKGQTLQTAEKPKRKPGRPRQRPAAGSD